MSTKIERFIEASEQVKRLCCDTYTYEDCRYCPFKNTNPYERDDCLFDSINHSLKYMAEHGDIIDA